MKATKTNRLCFGTIVLFFGSIIYVLFRVDSLLMFRWFATLRLNSIINISRQHSMPIATKLPDFIVYSLPDGLFVMSYITIMYAIWRQPQSMLQFIYFFLLPGFLLLSEVLQLFELIPGTFDVNDIIAYTIGIIIPVFFFSFNLSREVL